MGHIKIMNDPQTPAFKAHKAPAKKAKTAPASGPKGAPVTKDKLAKAAEGKAAEEKAKSHAAQALKEAEARKAKEAEQAKEIGGPEGPEPTRYGRPAEACLRRRRRYRADPASGLRFGRDPRPRSASAKCRPT